MSQSQCRKSHQIPMSRLGSHVLGLHLNWRPTAEVTNSVPHFITGKINTILCASPHKIDVNHMSLCIAVRKARTVLLKKDGSSQH